MSEKMAVRGEVSYRFLFHCFVVRNNRVHTGKDHSLASNGEDDLDRSEPRKFENTSLVDGVTQLQDEYQAVEAD